MGNPSPRSAPSSPRMSSPSSAPSRSGGSMQRSPR
jgi:hypothetical protein